MQSTIKTYLQPAFLICTAVLAITASGMSIAVKSFGVYLKKEPLPLKKSLDFLDEKGLEPYKVIAKEKIKNEDIIKSLGTEDYIQWILEDSEAAADSSVRKCQLFITYYSTPDRVPHVPEECYTGGGYQKLSSDDVNIKINRVDPRYFKGYPAFLEPIPARYLVFAGADSRQWWNSSRFPVLYFFKVNDVYANSREDTRIALNKNIFGRYSYFSKVEWNFFNVKFGAKVYPDKEEAITASQKLLGVILPVLESEHWAKTAETNRIK